MFNTNLLYVYLMLVCFPFNGHPIVKNFTIESKALEAGILFAQCRGCSAVVLEGDSQVLVNALAGSSPSPSAMASVIQGALELCMGFSQIQFSHVKRQGNMSAHLVAKNAYSIVDDIVWVEEDPCFAKQALIHDVNFMVPLL